MPGTKFPLFFHFAKNISLQSLSEQFKMEPSNIKHSIEVSLKILQSKTKKCILLLNNSYENNKQIFVVNTLRTYVIGHYNPSVSIIELVSHTTYLACVNFIHKWRVLQFKVASERQIFLRNFSWQFYLLSEILAEIC